MLYTCKLHAARACRDDGSCGCSNTPFDPFDPSTPTPTPTPTSSLCPGQVCVRLGLALPPPFTLVPRLLVQSAAGAVMRSVTQRV